MGEIVFVGKNNELYTTSKIVAEKSEVKHHAVQQLISNHEPDFREFGVIAFEMRKPECGSKGGRPSVVYKLNEQQATLLMTYLKNTPPVRQFKKDLVRRFFAMREILYQLQSTEWLLTRKQGKLVRRNETDILAELAEYATQQGSKNMSKQVYQVYTKLVNSLVGIEKGGRETAPFKTLSVIMFLEDMILNTVRQEMENGTYYKEIYRKCKENGESIMRFAYLPGAPSIGA